MRVNTAKYSGSLDCASGVTGESDPLIIRLQAWPCPRTLVGGGCLGRKCNLWKLNERRGEQLPHRLQPAMLLSKSSCLRLPTSRPASIACVGLLSAPCPFPVLPGRRVWERQPQHISILIGKRKGDRGSGLAGEMALPSHAFCICCSLTGWVTRGKVRQGGSAVTQAGPHSWRPTVQSRVPPWGSYPGS